MTVTLRARDVILEFLAAFPDEFNRTVLAIADNEAVLAPAQDGGWGVVEILPHLHDWEEIHFERARTIVEQDRPRLPAHDDELWAIERDYRGQASREAFERFRALRHELVAYLSGLPPEAWERTGIHGGFGEISLLWLGNRIHEHDQEHLRQAHEALA